MENKELLGILGDFKRGDLTLNQANERILVLFNVVEPKGKFYCKKGTCTEEQQCNHCWNAEHPFNQVMQ